MKCNFDGSFYNTATQSRAGWVVRDNFGSFKFAAKVVGNKVSSPLEGEFQALLLAMQHCWVRGLKKVCFEGDNQQVIDTINSRKLQFDLYNWVREIRWWSRKFEDSEFRWIGRQGNMVADKLAKDPIPNGGLFICYNLVPVAISTFLHKDYVCSSNM